MNGSGDTEWDWQNFCILGHAGRYYHFTNMCYEWQSYDVWFLRHRARRAEFFVILDNFLHFYPTNNPENQDFEELKKKKCPEISPFYTNVPKLVMDVIFIFHFGLFFAFLPPPQLKQSKF